MLYLITYSYDWNEGHISFTDLDDAEAWIRQEFLIPADVKAWTQTFWEMHTEAYEAYDWKSFQFLKIDLETGEVS